MSFLTISNENIFLKTQGTRLGATVATSNKGLEWALKALKHMMKIDSVDSRSSIPDKELHIKQLQTSSRGILGPIGQVHTNFGHISRAPKLGGAKKSLGKKFCESKHRYFV